MTHVPHQSIAPEIPPGVVTELDDTSLNDLILYSMGGRSISDVHESIGRIDNSYVEKKYGIISYITPEQCHDIDQVAHSLLAQTLPPGWTLSWTIYLHPEVTVDDYDFAHDERVFFMRGDKTLTAAEALDCAAIMSTGEILRVVDVSTIVPQGQFLLEVEIFNNYPEISWTILKKDSHTAKPDSHSVELDEGPLLAHDIFTSLSDDYNDIVVDPSTIAIRSNILWGVGGWGSVSLPEDIDLVKILDHIGGGYLASTVHSDELKKRPPVKLNSDHAMTMIHQILLQRKIDTLILMR